MKKYEAIHPLKFSLAIGFSVAIFVFILTIIVILFPNQNIEHTKIIFDMYGYFGYRETFFGALVGAFFSFIDSFFITFIAILIYNKLI